MESQDLFKTNAFHDVVEQHKAAALREIDGINSNDLLSTNSDALTDYIVASYGLQAPVLRDDERTLSTTKLILLSVVQW